MMHSGTLNKVRNFEAAAERAANEVLAKIDPVETQRTQSLSQVVHDDLIVYNLASDFKKIISLIPQDNLTSLDKGARVLGEPFNLGRSLKNKTISIVGSEGNKVLKINWRSNSAKIFHSMNSLTDNGTWSTVGSATGLRVNTLYKLSGSGSIEFDLVASGDGIENSSITPLDLSSWATDYEVIVPIFIVDATNLTSLTPIWGSDLTDNYYTGVAQTSQADGTAFRNGWNYIKVSAVGATPTGTPVTTAIGAFKITVQATGAMSNIKVDNILFSLGRPFDLTYYSKYIFRSTAGVWLPRPTSDDDTVVLDGTAINIYLFELLKACAQQVQGEDSSFDITYASKELQGDPDSPDAVSGYGLYARYRSEYPSESKKAVSSYSSGPRYRR